MTLLQLKWCSKLKQNDFPVESQVTDTINKYRKVFEEVGCTTEDAFPDFKDADEIFMVFRAWMVEAQHRKLFTKLLNKKLTFGKLNLK